MSRLFTFGCSFTQYQWPTWADILGQQHDFFENWGKLGGGNHFIFNSLMECINSRSISADDTIMIMWSSISREDRWVSGRGWVTPGSIYNQTEYDSKFVQKWADPNGYLIRDMAFISAARRILDSIGCAWCFMSIVPFDYHDDSKDPDNFSFDNRIKKVYNDDIGAIKPSVYETVFRSNWYSRAGPIDKSALAKKYDIFKGVNWPNKEDFLNDNLNQVPINVFQEIIGLFRKDKIRTNNHPTPLEHLDYINKVMPEINILHHTFNWVKQADEAILTNKEFLWDRHLPSRI